MPLREYRCAACGHEETVLERRAGAPRAARCGECGSKRMEPQLSGFAIQKTLKSRVQELDPKYDRMVEDAMEKSSSADPGHYLRKMRSFDEAPE